MGRLQSLVRLDAVSTQDLRLPCKVVAYFNLILYAFCALVMHIFGIVSALSGGFHPRRLLYGKQNSSIFAEAKEIEESWMICRAVFSYFVLKGVREENPAYVLPVLIDATTQIAAAIIFLVLQPFSYNEEINLKRVVQLVLGFLLDFTLIVIVGNYYRRLRMGNLEAESEQPGA